MTSKQISMEQAYDLLQDGKTYMIGGFAEVGTPYAMIDGLIERNVKDITMISNDTGNIEKPGTSELILANRVTKAIVSHVGKNPETGRQSEQGTLNLELVPQGTLTERIRCGGAGIGGVYLRTGLGTVVANGKETKIIVGETYLLELPLRADIALIHAAKGDAFGNLVFHMTARNYNPIMATAADIVIAEVDEFVEAGAISPNEVMLPGVYVDYIVKTKERVLQ